MVTRRTFLLLTGLGVVCALLGLNYALNAAKPPSATATTVSPTTSASLPKISISWTRDFPSWVVDYNKPVHFTHVFSTYSVPTTSSEYKETALVQYSWLQAAEFARKTRGIQVEYIDCTLPNDTASSPSFASRYDLHWLVPDIRLPQQQEKLITTIGEYYKVALEKGRGQFVIGSNMDIGVVEDFYVRAYDWANRDYTSPAAQLEAMQLAAEFYSKCYFAKPRDSVERTHQKFCAEDCRAMYLNKGGYVTLWDQVKREVAMLAAKLTLQQQQSSKPDLAVLNSMIRTLLDNNNRGEVVIKDKSVLLNFSPSAPQPKQQIVNRDFAGTITRLDITDTLLTQYKSKEEAYKHVSGAITSAADIHPGNDCFVFTRLATPKVLTKFPHPAGLRPFGAWIPLMFTENGVQFRRISATTDNAWTFHVGKGLWGGKQDQFKARVTANPTYFLFLAGNFNLLSNSRVLEWQFTAAPELCLATAEGYRQASYCGKSPGAICVGSMRLACERYQNVNLRDGQMYLQHCLALHATALGKVQEPICSLCNFFFKLKRLEKRFTCLAGRMEQFCKYLPDEACAHMEATLAPTRMVTQTPTVKPTLAPSSSAPIEATREPTLGAEPPTLGTEPPTNSTASPTALAEDLPRFVLPRLEDLLIIDEQDEMDIVSNDQASVVFEDFDYEGYTQAQQQPVQLSLLEEAKRLEL